MDSGDETVDLRVFQHKKLRTDHKSLPNIG